MGMGPVLLFSDRNSHDKYNAPNTKLKSHIVGYQKYYHEVYNNCSIIYLIINLFGNSVINFDFRYWCNARDFLVKLPWLLSFVL